MVFCLFPKYVRISVLGRVMLTSRTLFRPFSIFLVIFGNFLLSLPVYLPVFCGGVSLLGVLLSTSLAIKTSSQHRLGPTELTPHLYSLSLPRYLCPRFPPKQLRTHKPRSFWSGVSENRWCDQNLDGVNKIFKSVINILMV